MGDLKKLYMQVNSLINMEFNMLNKTWVIKTKHHKHPNGHNAYACALDLGHTC